MNPWDLDTFNRLDVIAWVLKQGNAYVSNNHFAAEIEKHIRIWELHRAQKAVERITA